MSWLYLKIAGSASYVFPIGLHPNASLLHWKRFVRDFSGIVAVTVVEIVLCTDTSMSENITYKRGLANILYSAMYSVMYQIF